MKRNEILIHATALFPPEYKQPSLHICISGIVPQLAPFLQISPKANLSYKLLIK